MARIFIHNYRSLGNTCCPDISGSNNLRTASFENLVTPYSTARMTPMFGQQQPDFNVNVNVNV